MSQIKIYNFIIIQQKGAKMIKENTSPILTQEGISILFSQAFQQREFVLQVLQIHQSEEAYNVFLSDGSACVQGQLINQAKKNAIQWSLMPNNIIKFNVDSFEAIPNNQYSFNLRSFTILSALYTYVIGLPAPFKEIKKKQNFPNLESGSINIIQHYNTISEVKKMAPSLLQLRILGKVIKKPERINSVMNIVIQDEEGEQIQCCFFTDTVQRYRDLIQIGIWYYFQNPVLQFNNKVGIMELKINSQSKVTKSANISDVKPGIINHNNNYPLKHKQEESNKGLHKNSKEFNIKDYSGIKFFEENDKFIIARPIKLFQFKNNVGKIYTCIDKMGNEVQILLWNDCNAQIKLNETYRFDGLKAKIYKQKISLQSQRCKTQVTLSSIKILSSIQAFSGIIDNPKVRRLKYLGQNDIIYSINQMRQKCQKSSEKSVIINSCGYLTIRFDNINGNSVDIYSDLRKKLFYVHCEKCESNEYQKVKIQLENMNGKVICSNCKSEQIRIMWNIKAIFMDSQTEIACKINSEIAQKLIDLTPAEGMLMYLQNPDDLKILIMRKLHFMRGVFKFSSKPNDNRHDRDRFYNICQCYEDTSKDFAKRAVVKLKMAIAAFNKYSRLDPIICNNDQIVSQNPQNKASLQEAPAIKSSNMEEQIQ